MEKNLIYTLLLVCVIASILLTVALIDSNQKVRRLEWDLEEHMELIKNLQKADNLLNKHLLQVNERMTEVDSHIEFFLTGKWK